MEYKKPQCKVYADSTINTALFERDTCSLSMDLREETEWVVCMTWPASRDIPYISVSFVFLAELLSPYNYVLILAVFWAYRAYIHKNQISFVM